MDKDPYNDPDNVLDRVHHREAEHETAGFDSLHQRSPAEIVSEREEMDADEAARAAAEREALRSELFAAMLDYLFAAGPDPRDVRARIEACLESFHPTLHLQIGGPTEWADGDEIEATLRKHAPAIRRLQSVATANASLYQWSAALEAEADQVTINRTLKGLAGHLAREEKTWKNLTAAAFAVAKALRAELLAGMSLADIAVLCGDGGGRATPSNRGKRLVNRPIEENTQRPAQLHYQKNASTIEKYRAAQKGNHNRRKQPQRKRKAS